MIKKYVFILLVIFLLVVNFSVYIFISLFPWFAVNIYTLMLPNPKEPDIKYGEFDFYLEYKINEDRFIVEDVLICEYVGINVNEGTGKNRTWKAHWKSGEQNLSKVIYEINENLVIRYESPGAEYFMGEPEYLREAPIPYIILVDETTWRIKELTKEELLKEYGIELIYFSCSEPIKNDFN